jgi:hypothetical protein
MKCDILREIGEKQTATGNAVCVELLCNGCEVIRAEYVILTFFKICDL